MDRKCSVPPRPGRPTTRAGKLARPSRNFTSDFCPAVPRILTCTVRSGCSLRARRMKPEPSVLNRTAGGGRDSGAGRFFSIRRLLEKKTDRSRWRAPSSLISLFSLEGFNDHNTPRRRRFSNTFCESVLFSIDETTSLPRFQPRMDSEDRPSLGHSLRVCAAKNEVLSATQQGEKWTKRIGLEFLTVGQHANVQTPLRSNRGSPQQKKRVLWRDPLKDGTSPVPSAGRGRFLGR